MSDQLNHMLFETEGLKLINLKFMRGTDAVGEEHFRRAAGTIIFEIEQGIANTRDMFGDIERRTVNVTELVGSL